MSDMYRELMIGRPMQAKDKMQKYGLTFLTMLMGLAGFFVTPWAFILFVGLCILDYLIFPSFHVEYEYLYVNGELDIDRILAKSKRKRVGSYDMTKMEKIALWKSHEMDPYRQKINKKNFHDFSSGKADAKVYAMAYETSEKGMELILFEPDELILKDISRTSPRKVVIE